MLIIDNSELFAHFPVVSIDLLPPARPPLTWIVAATRFPAHSMNFSVFDFLDGHLKVIASFGQERENCVNVALPPPPFSRQFFLGILLLNGRAPTPFLHGELTTIFASGNEFCVSMDDWSV